ncbi:hypothetical protein [Gryllotalpicola protaetiae]|uniref:Uncharacterized protein n=1 Tax=Gryllotalpicola protaetiae TaxID=2419771 RepID=A0A387BT37_9MICO|nr:hypothetical protein [Gryllotalpicola protaetiae]AYG04230.1 hypothetical protein D7I44_12290 [Gryllotalpicola protaetiae]
MKAPIRSTAAVLAAAGLLALAGCAGGAPAGLTDEHPTPTTAPIEPPTPRVTVPPTDSLPIGRVLVPRAAPPAPEKLPPGRFAKRPQ